MSYSVIKRDGRRTAFQKEKLAARLRKLSYKLDPEVNVDRVVDLVIQHLETEQKDIETRDIDLLASRFAKELSPDYRVLASRVKVAHLHKETKKDLPSVLAYFDSATPLNVKVDPATLETLKTHADDLNGAIVHDRDYDLSIDALEEIESNNLVKRQGQIVERPSHMMMRLAVDRMVSKRTALRTRDPLDVDQIIDAYHTLSKTMMMAC